MDFSAGGDNLPSRELCWVRLWEFLWPGSREVAYRDSIWHRVRGWPWGSQEFRGRIRYCSWGWPWLKIDKLLWIIYHGKYNIFEIIMGKHRFPYDFCLIKPLRKIFPNPYSHFHHLPLTPPPPILYNTSQSHQETQIKYISIMELLITELLKGAIYAVELILPLPRVFSAWVNSSHRLSLDGHPPGSHLFLR